MSDYNYSGPLNGGYAIQDKFITNELKEFCISTYEWETFFKADGVTEHSNLFIEQFNAWIRSSKLNNIQGLDAFPHVTQTNGTSEAFSMQLVYDPAIAQTSEWADMTKEGNLARLAEMGITDPDKVYEASELACGEHVVFAGRRAHWLRTPYRGR